MGSILDDSPTSSTDPLQRENGVANGGVLTDVKEAQDAVKHSSVKSNGKLNKPSVSKHGKRF